MGADGVKPPLVTTSGTFEIRVVPDLAELSFEIEVRHASLDEARQQQAKRSTKVLAALRAAGIAETDLKAEQVVIHRRYVGGRGGGGGYFSVGLIEPTQEEGSDPPETESKEYFVVSQQITCQLKDISKVTDVTASVLTAGATTSQRATLLTSELRKYRDEARIKAIRFAKEKATALATELGAKVGKPYSITEGTGPDWWGQNNSNGAQGSGGEPVEPSIDSQPTFAPGTITVSATVEVSFLLE